MVEDLMTIVHCFSRRLYGLRNYKKSLKLALVESDNKKNMKLGRRIAFDLNDTQAVYMVRAVGRIWIWD